MAILYIDPHKSSPGNGTFANAFSFSQSTKGSLTSGDTIRVISVPLANLLTANVYTASFNSTTGYQLSVPGAAEITANSIIYLPQYDTFAKILSSSVTGATNTISLYSSYNPMPIANTQATSITVRKVDTANYAPALTAATGYLLNSTGTFSGINVSDGWIDATTRVTDGTAKTLFHSNNGGVSLSFSFDTTTSYDNVFDLNQTHFIGTNSIQYSYYSTFAFYGSNTSLNIAQFTTGYLSGGMTIGSSTSPTKNTYVSINTAIGTDMFQTCYGKNVTFTANNIVTYYTDAWSGSGQNFISYCDNMLLNIGNLVSYTAGAYLVTGTYFAFDKVVNANVYLNGVLDNVSTNPSSFMIGNGNVNFNFGPNFTVKATKRTSTPTNWTNLVSHNTVYTNYSGGNRHFIPKINLPVGYTATTPYTFGVSIFGAASSSTGFTMDKRVPNSAIVDSPVKFTSATSPYGVTDRCNILLSFRDGSDPTEILSIYGENYITAAANTNFPLVSKDYSVYRTSAPSLKSLLVTRNATYWNYNSQPPNIHNVATKPIRVPLVGNVSTTVSGYIRTDDTLYANGDCIMTLYANNTILAVQNMTTSCINNWEQFSLSYTPTANIEAYLLWDMYYENGNKSYWLDDLTVS